MYLPIRLPVFWEETRRRLRGGRSFAVLAAFIGALLALLLFLVLTDPLTSDSTAWPEFGRRLWHLVFFGQLIVLVLIAPGITAGSVSAEREHGTLDLLFLTPQSTLALVAGKFLGAVAQTVMVILAGLPVVSVVFVFGGVSPWEVAGRYAFILTCALFYAALGFLASCLCRRVGPAVAWAYGFMLIFTLGVPLLAILSIIFDYFAPTGSTQWLSALAGPLAMLFDTIEKMQNTDTALFGPVFWGGLIGTVVEILVILTVCIFLLRRLRTAASVLRPKPKHPRGKAPAPIP